MSLRTIIIALVFLGAIGWGFYNSNKPVPDFAAAHDGKVILYATSWCGYCTKARELLKENDIEYFEYDVENSQEGHEQFKTLGGKGVARAFDKG